MKVSFRVESFYQENSGINAPPCRGVPVNDTCTAVGAALDGLVHSLLGIGSTSKEANQAIP